MTSKPSATRAAEIFGEVDPNLRVISGGRHFGKSRKSLAEYQENQYSRTVRELDNQGNPGPALICHICRREAEELLPYGYMRARLACRECLERQKRMLEAKARVLAARAIRGASTKVKMRMIKYAAKQKQRVLAD